MRMHPEDREYVVNYCVSQSQAGQDHEADYRALTKDNGYVWIRDVVHVVRNDKGEAEALIGFMFDITERKKTEEKLLLLQKELEVLSFKDGLTNIANRRRFDSSFDLEWERARHERQPPSMLLFDVDYFKQYNDLYGPHPGRRMPGGDRPDAEPGAGRSARSRGGATAARSLSCCCPEADAEVARKVAERCQRLIEKKSIVHALSPHGRRVTVSIGAGTVVPDGQTKPAGFIQAVDQQLYAAKEEWQAPHRTCAAVEPSGQAPNQGLAGLAKPFDNSHNVYYVKYEMGAPADRLLPACMPLRCPPWPAIRPG